MKSILKERSYLQFSLVFTKYEYPFNRTRGPPLTRKSLTQSPTYAVSQNLRNVGTLSVVYLDYEY